jgi:UDP-N-acetylmuramate--alanine ligase
MSEIDLSVPRRVHVVGAGGAAMSAMAVILDALGHTVTGSDAVDTPYADRLRARGIALRIGYQADNLGDAELVAVQSALHGNPEVEAATARGIPMVSRPELQGAICRLRRTVAVAGTHGKTTTSAMLALALRDAGLSPSAIVGGVVAGLDPGDGWLDASGPFVVEADESDGTFLRLGADAVLVTNVEPDHLDHWGDFAALQDGFRRFVEGAAGPKVVCADDEGAAALAAAVPGCTTYGTADGAAYRLEGDAVRCPDGERVPLTLPVPGLHNLRNAVGALAMADLLGADRAAVAASLAAFPGVARRWEERGVVKGITFVDSYDHLPTEVRAVLAAARTTGHRRIVCVFQPHRYTRTRDVWRDLGDAFDDADVVGITDVYAAGQAPIPGVTGKLIVDAVLGAHPWKRVAWLPRLDDVVSWLRAELRPGDLCLTLGAGDLTTVPDRVLEALGGAGGRPLQSQ